MKVQEPFEMPKDIEDIDWFFLNNRHKNREFYKVCVGKDYQYKKKLFAINEYASVYQHKSEFFCLDKELKKVTYYMKYQVDTKPKIGQYVWQSLVWADPEAQGSYISGIAKKMFFEYLLPKFHVITTDSEQSWRGKRFWQIRIGDALRMGLNVYFYDFQSKELVKLQKYDDLQDYQEKYDIWGETDKHLLKRMVITNKDLNEIKRIV